MNEKGTGAAATASTVAGAGAGPRGAGLGPIGVGLFARKLLSSESLLSHFSSCSSSSNHY
jgi:hypothetical protein